MRLRVLMLIPLMAAGCKKTTPAASAVAATALADSQSGVSDTADQAAKPPLPAWKPVQSGATAPTIPLERGLVLVTAVQTDQGDYESIKKILDVSPTTVSLGYSAEVRPSNAAAPSGDADSASAPPTRVSGVRSIDVADLQHAHGYAAVFRDDQSEHFPGTTAISASTELLSELHAKKPVEFHFAANPVSGLIHLGAQALGLKLGDAAISLYAGVPMYTCTLHQVEPTDLAVPVLVNDQRVELPAVHAMCSLEGGKEAHLYYLDQPDNPITLAYQLGEVDWRLQVIKITLPSQKELRAPPAKAVGDAGPRAGEGASQMEEALAEKKPVEVYSFYFDFNRATMKPESEVVLQQIAGILRKHPDWTLSVSGYTDNIGGDAFNLGLSQRRAAAVKDALVTRYSIAPARLVTNGYGASSPIETNETIEGRARNRRVELQRQ